MPGENATDTRLMIAVGIPAFDRSYMKPNSSAKARLLGVAGTDVPVEDIDKLTLPYKVSLRHRKFSFLKFPLIPAWSEWLLLCGVQ